MSSHRRPNEPVGLLGHRGVRATVLTAAAATAAATFSGSSAGAAPQTRPASPESRVQELFAQAERATEEYNAAKERSERLHDQAERLQDRAARSAAELNELRGTLGRLAGAQYRSGGVDPNLSLLLSQDPDGYLERAATLERISSLQTGRLTRMRQAQQALEQQRAQATGVLADLERTRDVLAGKKRAVVAKLAQARRLAASLPGMDAAAASRSGVEPLPGYGAGLPSSSRAAMAVAAARRAVGTPYVWGGTGGGGFDCSGLTQWAYREAGVSLPRTSQGQRYAGRRVPLGQARPGDLVTYRGDASHVGMYMGNGQVVHAPYPGASVRYDPVDMMPIASVTRP
ncbi:NlpC/P60 family protein [Streptomyces sp. NPDC051940]|uniref:NlpC/P60 family protein n=1 Tax=Streptomyces sp. NPDC051940 TaxID=3155675 RepID=UPI003415F110